MKKLIISLCMLLGFLSISYSQNLDSLSVSKRTTLLLSVSKKIIMKHGSGYYREYKTPKIERKIFSYDPRMFEEDKKDIGRAYYHITYYYDKQKERLERDFAARVSVWADTSKPRAVTFGNGWGVRLDLPKTRDSGEVTVIPYDSLPLKKKQ